MRSSRTSDIKMVVGPWKKISSNLFGELLGDVMPKYQLASMVDTTTGTVEFKLSVTASYHDRATDPITGKPVHRQHADTTGIWPSFYGATTSSGDFRSVQRLSRYASPCNSNGCLYTETASVSLKVEDIEQPLSSGTGFSLSVNSRTGQHQEIEIPFHYLQGIGTKVAEMVGGSSNFSKIVLQNRSGLVK